MLVLEMENSSVKRENNSAHGGFCDYLMFL